MPPTPLILTTFANPKDQGHLQYLEKEKNRLQEIISQLPYIDHLSLDSTSSKELVDVLGGLKYSLQVFHFGGHAKEQVLLFNDTEGQGAGLVQLLSIYPNLKLVFLNACDTQHTAELFIQAGVPAVITTICPVQDGIALRFAEVFYHWLIRGNTLVDAFNASSAAEHLHVGGTSENEIVELRGLEIQMDTIPDTTWKLFANKEMFDWKLTDLEPIPSLSGHKVTYEELKTIKQQVKKLVKEEDYERAINRLENPALEALFLSLEGMVQWVKAKVSNLRSREGNLTLSYTARDAMIEAINQYFTQIVQLLDALINNHPPR